MANALESNVPFPTHLQNGKKKKTQRCKFSCQKVPWSLKQPVKHRHSLAV